MLLVSPWKGVGVLFVCGWLVAAGSVAAQDRLSAPSEDPVPAGLDR